MIDGLVDERTFVYKKSMPGGRKPGAFAAFNHPAATFCPSRFRRDRNSSCQPERHV